MGLEAYSQAGQVYVCTTRKGTTYPFSNLLVTIFFSLSIVYPFSLSRQVFRLHGVEPDQQPLALIHASGNLISNTQLLAIASPRLLSPYNLLP
jgi:hypothetical protein